MKKIFNENEGVWRTISGRRVFIREGQSLSDAMKESGKFKNWRDKMKNREERKEITDKIIDDGEKKKVEDFWEEEDAKQKLSDREIRDLKSQKSLKELAEEGKAKDITRYSDDENRKLNEKHGRLEVIKVIKGVYGMNSALLQSRETGEYFVITSRNSTLFYWV